MDSAGSRPRSSQKAQLGLVHGGHAPPGKRMVQRIASALAFEDGHELLLVLLEAAQDGIGYLAVHRDVQFSGKGEGVGRLGRDDVGEMGVMGIMGVMYLRGGEHRTSNIQHPTSNIERRGKAATK